jgi:branched-subunit amino acid transport protein
MTHWEIVATLLGMGVVTVVTRAFFLIPRRDLPMPGWLRRGLRYAPLGAMAAVVVPEIAMTPQGELISGWRDARLFAVAASTAYYFWRRDILGTIVAGTAVMLVLRIGLGW